MKYLKSSCKKDYPSFVAESGQINTPPGSYETIKRWIKNSFIDKNSRILEIGCSNGFISYQINKYTNARVIGIDPSKKAIEFSRKNCFGIEKLNFFIGSCDNLKFKNEYFTHVIIGGHLPWIPKRKRKKHLREALRVLKPGGFLLTSLYYFSKIPPKNFLNKFNCEFKTKLSSKDNYGYWSSLFNLEELHGEYESNFIIRAPSKKRKNEYLSVFRKHYKDDWNNKVNLFEKNARYISFFIKIFRKDDNLKYKQNPRGEFIRGKN